MQIQLYLAACGQLGEKTVFDREVTYPGTNKKCDFQITSATTQVVIWIELKVMLHDDPASLVNRFLADVQKLQGLELPIDTNTVGAIAWAPAGAAAFIDTLKAKILNKAKLYYAVLQDGQKVWSGRLDENYKFKGAESVLTWYVAIS